MGAQNEAHLPRYESLVPLKLATSDMSFSSEDATNYFGLPLLLLLTFGTIYLCKRMSEMPEREKTTREHGITYPWDKWQIIVVTATIYNIFVFFGVASRAIDDQIGWCFFYGLFLLLTICLWLYMSLMDPCIGKTEEPLGNEYWCRFCQSYYDGEKRKHCRHCKKCVVGFAHHCFFLNTCIADHNYKPCVTLLCAYTCVLTLQLLGVCVAISRIVNNDADSVFGDVGAHFFLWTSLMCTFPSWCGACALLALHIYFISTGTNTFKWLKQDYEEEKLRAKLKAYEVEMTKGIDALSVPKSDLQDAADVGVSKAVVESNPVAEPSGIVADVEVIVAEERA